MVPLSLMITLILFLVESNSNDLSNLTFFSFPIILKHYSLADDPINWNPNLAAASTSVISSGDGP